MKTNSWITAGEAIDYRQAPTHWWKSYDEAVIEWEARTTVVQLKSEA